MESPIRVNLTSVSAAPFSSPDISSLGLSGVQTWQKRYFKVDAAKTKLYIFKVTCVAYFLFQTVELNVVFSGQIEVGPT